MEDSELLSSNLRVIMEDLESHPSCSHGPSLLFARSDKGGKERRFFACSACRSRKDCNFFMWENVKKKKEKRQLKLPESSQQSDDKNRSYMFHNVLKLPEKKRGYCHTCNYLFNIKEKEKHGEHDVLLGVSDHLIRHPSELLKQLECSKKEAQYMFSTRSIDFICNSLKELNVISVICIGAPRIHERILETNTSKMRTLLLDIDERYYNFYRPDQFCHYNMFNNYFFGGENSRKIFVDAIRGADHKVAIVIDPPFGGRVEPLAFTLQSLQELQQDIPSSSPMPVLWAFPYFMEPYIRGTCPDFTMLDYKVDYENHTRFKTGKKKRESPVRIFTNVSPSKIPLPAAEGYHYCSICERWVAPENKHCEFCNCCTSKDGRTYKHCHVCERCVKPTWDHCVNCGRCCLPEHNCGQVLPRPVACFCGSMDHLAKECPLKSNSSEKQLSKKRNRNVTKEVKKKKYNHIEHITYMQK